MRRSCRIAANSPMAASGRTGAFPSIRIAPGCTFNVTSPLVVNRADAATTRASELVMAGWVAG